MISSSSLGTRPFLRLETTPLSSGKERGVVSREESGVVSSLTFSQVEKVWRLLQHFRVLLECQLVDVRGLKKESIRQYSHFIGSIQIPLRQYSRSKSHDI